MRSFLLALAVLSPAFAAANPRTVVALEDTHFRRAGGDVRGLEIDILIDLATHQGATSFEIDESASPATLKAQILAAVAALPDNDGSAPDEPCNGQTVTAWSYDDADGAHHDVALCPDGTGEHRVDGVLGPL